MKKIFIYAIFLVFTKVSFAQVNVQSVPNAVIYNQNPFLDASGYRTAAKDIGKGLYFPRTNLTTWEFETSSINPGRFATYFDGMIVYNSATGQTVADVTKGGKQVSVTPGFYYFYNPNKTAPGGNINEGEWRRLDSTAKSGPWNIQNTTDIATDNSSDIYQMGKVAVGVDNFPSSPSSTNVKLYVEGDVEVNGKLWTSNSVYADYVFEDYFVGKSNINPSYSFNKLEDVKNFIEKNHHLPGVTSIGELKKDENGYMIDFSKLTIQQLEKIEELFIHTIEQQNLIDNQANEINSLKSQVNDAKDRLERLEMLLINVQK